MDICWLEPTASDSSVNFPAAQVFASPQIQVGRRAADILSAESGGLNDGVAIIKKVRAANSAPVGHGIGSRGCSIHITAANHVSSHHRVRGAWVRGGRARAGDGPRLTNSDGGQRTHGL